MIPQPEITTIITTYRRPRLLPRAISSALGQTYPHLRVLVLDNDSGDETSDIVREMAEKDPRIRYHRHPKNLGMFANFQFGLDAVETSFFSFLGDDDMLLPGFYEHAVGQLRRYSEARFCCGQTVFFNPLKGFHEPRPGRGWESRLYRSGDAAVRMVESHFIWTATLFSREVRDTIRTLERTLAFDIIFLAEAAARFPFVVSLQPWAVFTHTDDTSFNQRTVRECTQTFSTLRDRCLELPGLSPEQRTRAGAVADRKLHNIMERKFRRAFLEGDWPTFDEAGAYLEQRGDLTLGRRLRVRLARGRNRSSLLLRAARAYLKSRRASKRESRSRGQHFSIDQIVQIYSEARLDQNRSRP